MPDLTDEALARLIEDAEWHVGALEEAGADATAALWFERLAAYRELQARRAAHRTSYVIHGRTCEKVPHARDGYLHSEDDDTPYDVDGVRYCGRCHMALGQREED